MSFFGMLLNEFTAEPRRYVTDANGFKTCLNEGELNLAWWRQGKTGFEVDQKRKRDAVDSPVRS